MERLNRRIRGWNRNLGKSDKCPNGRINVNPKKPNFHYHLFPCKSKKCNRSLRTQHKHPQLEKRSFPVAAAKNLFQPSRSFPLLRASLQLHSAAPFSRPRLAVPLEIHYLAEQQQLAEVVRERVAGDVFGRREGAAAGRGQLQVGQGCQGPGGGQSGSCL